MVRSKKARVASSVPLGVFVSICRPEQKCQAQRLRGAAVAASGAAILPSLDTGSGAGLPMCAGMNTARLSLDQCHRAARLSSQVLTETHREMIYNYQLTQEQCKIRTSIWMSAAVSAVSVNTLGMS